MWNSKHVVPIFALLFSSPEEGNEGAASVIDNLPPLMSYLAKERMRKRKAFADKELEEVMKKRNEDAEVLELQLTLQLQGAATQPTTPESPPQASVPTATPSPPAPSLVELSGPPRYHGTYSNNLELARKDMRFMDSENSFGASPTAESASLNSNLRSWRTP
jgi:hypothetical protein